MRHALLACSLGAALLGCASPGVQLETERGYRIEWLGARPALDASQPTLTLGEDGRTYGSSGCNHWFARYALLGAELRFEAIGSTRKLCAPALMEQEARLFDSLAKVRRWDVSPLEQLRLWPESGKPLRLAQPEG